MMNIGTDYTKGSYEWWISGQTYSITLLIPYLKHQHILPHQYPYLLHRFLHDLWLNEQVWPPDPPLLVINELRIPANFLLWLCATFKSLERKYLFINIVAVRYYIGVFLLCLLPFSMYSIFCVCLIFQASVF